MWHRHDTHNAARAAPNRHQQQEADEIVNVTQITEHHSREVIDTLQYLLHRAEKGQIRALASSIKTGRRKHRIGFSGQYWDDPLETLGCVTRMEYTLNG